MMKIRTLWRRDGKLFVSLIILAAVLPVIFWAAISKNKVSVGTEAESVPELRLWWEPAEVVTTPGQVVELKMMAEYQNPAGLVTEVSARVEITPQSAVEPANLKLVNAFTGREEVGKVRITVGARGVYWVEIPAKSVLTGTTTLPVVTSPAKITVR